MTTRFNRRDQIALDASPGISMRMRYGVNQADQCWDFAVGGRAGRIQSLLRDIDTQMIRLFLFDKGGADPIADWPTFVSYVDAVLKVGATPMITFAKFFRPFDDPRAVRWFAEQCSDVVWGSIEQWGGDVVKDWYWCVWNEPNSDWIGGGLSFEQYKNIYEQIAHRAERWLRPYLGDRKLMMGGPAVEGFQNFWMDWIWRFVNEIDNDLIGFVDWHHYGDWREHGEAGAPGDSATHLRLLMSQTQEFEARARNIGRLLQGRNIENICGELNCHSHYWTEVRERINKTVFAGTFYASALLHLIRGGADVEMFWTGTEDVGGYGMMSGKGEPAPSYYAKWLVINSIRKGDRVSSYSDHGLGAGFDIARSRRGNGEWSVLAIHKDHAVRSVDLTPFLGEDSKIKCALRLDEGTEGKPVSEDIDGHIKFEGYGVAILSSEVLRLPEESAGG